jgi:ubiquinone biosynthesis protein UbiJ
MSETQFDPVAAWQKFISDWEKQVNEASARVTGTEEFSRAMNQVTKFSMAAQQQFDKQMEQFLKTVHLPSKTDIAAIHDRLAAMEDAIERLTTALERSNRLGGTPPGGGERPAKIQVTRTRRPPAESS